jgi:WD40 repeat protein
MTLKNHCANCRAIFVFITAILASVLVAVSIARADEANDKPALVLQAGHSTTINSVVVSSDGKLILTASSDRTIKLWDAASGRVIRAFTGHTRDVYCALFSPDGKSIISASEDGTVRIWEIESGRAVRTLETKETVTGVALAVSPDGKLIVSSQEKTHIWDAATGQMLHKLDRRLLSLVFSPDGKMLAADGFNDKHTVELLNPQSGELIRELPANPSPNAKSLAFSPDGKTLAVITRDNTVDLWDVAKASVARSFHDERYSDMPAIAFSPDGKLLLISNAPGRGIIKKYLDLCDVRSGNLSKRIDVSDIDSFQAESVYFYPDGATFLTAGYTNLSEWSVTNGTLLRSFARAPEKRTSLVVNSSHGKILLGVQQTGAKLWDANFSVQSEFTDSDAFNKFYFSPDGRIAVTDNTSNYYLRFWRTDTGQKIGKLEESVDALRFSPDSQAIAILKGGNSIDIYDAQTIKLARTLRGHTGDVKQAEFTPDGKLLVSVSADKTARVWNWRTGESVWTLEGLTSFPNALALNDRTAAVICNDANITLFDLATGKRTRAWSAGKGQGWMLALSPDGRTLATATYEAKTQLWDTATGALQTTLTGEASRDFIAALAFSPDGQNLVECEGEKGDCKKTRLWKVKNGQLVREWDKEKLGLQITDASFTKDSKTLLLASDLQSGYSNMRDIVTRLYATTDGELLAETIGFADGSFVTVAPDGLFDGVPAAFAKLNWRFGATSVAPVEAFFNEFYYPGLLADLLAGRRPRAPRNISQIDRRQPKVELSYANKPTGGTVTTRTVKLALKITEAPPTANEPRGSGAQDVRVFHNGSLVKVFRGDVLKGERSATFETIVPVTAGENQFTAYAFNRNNVKSNDAALSLQGDAALARKGVARVLTIGLNAYANAQFNLRYAVADAREFGAQFQAAQSRLAQFAEVKVTNLFDSQATKGNILRAIADLAAASLPEDAAIVFFAGHGVAAQNQFYLIPYDLGFRGQRTAINSTDLKTILAHAISDRELEQSLELLNAGNVLFIIDACNSGQALESEEKRQGPMNSKGLAQLAYEKGMYILTAAQSYQAAQETQRFEHGLLTYALVEEGLKQGAADREPADGKVTIKEWFDYAVNRVPVLQIETTREAKRKLGLDSSANENGARNASDDANLQHPRAFYRREFTVSNFIVAQH